MNELKYLKTLLESKYKNIELDLRNPRYIDGIYFLFVKYDNKFYSIEYHSKEKYYGLSYEQDAGYGEKPDEIFRITELNKLENRLFKFLDKKEIV